MSQFYNPVAVYIGAEAVKQLASTLLSDGYMQVKRVLLLTRGSEVEKNDGLQPLMAAMQGKDIFLKELQLANPDLDDILKLKKELDAFDFGLIVAIGGGSVMDVAKTLSAMQRLTLETKADVRTAIADELYRKQDRFTPWIGIPTTSGTGSEVTSWATVWDEEMCCKYSIADERLYAKGAVIIPEMTVMMPLQLSAVTALDAMCHATEAYWSVRSNPITRIYSLEAIERVRMFLPRLKEDPANPHIRIQLAQASLYAGLAFSNTRTTACHSISYPLTLLHGMEHGIAASFTLGAVLLLNRHALTEPEKLLKAFGAEKPEDVQQMIFHIYDTYGIPNRLREYGVTPANIPDIVKRAYTKGRMDNNPVVITEHQLQEVLTALL